MGLAVTPPGFSWIKLELVWPRCRAEPAARGCEGDAAEVEVGVGKEQRDFLPCVHTQSAAGGAVEVPGLLCWASVLGWVVQAGGVPVSVFGYGCEKERLLGCRDRATRQPARRRAVRGVLGSTGGGGSMGRGRPGVPKSPLSRQPQVGLKRI